MPITEGSQSATEQWETFALALAASLAHFSPVQLAPRFSLGQLNTALATYLPLNDDELLLAMIDRGGRKATGRCALTTRRVYWTENDDCGELAGSAGPKRSNRRAKNGLVVRIAAYGDLPDQIAATESPTGSFAIDLGRGAIIKLGQVDRKLAAALARYLEMMGHAARAGTIPKGVIDPDLAVRAARVLPQVTRVTDQARAFGQDVSDFRNALQSATPRAVMTHVFTAACIIVYIAMVGSGVNWLWPRTTQLVDWGANQGIAVALNQQYWRLFTSVFLHGGLIHVAVNVWNILVIGPLVERLYGNLAFAVIYLASGVGGAIASLAASPLRNGVGASGAICGVLGGLVAFLIVHRRAIPKSILKSFWRSFLLVVVLTAVLGFLVPNIDQEAHLGGLVTGFLTGILLSRPWPVVKSRRAAVRRLIAPLLIAGALAGLAYGVVLRARAAVPAGVRLQQLESQIQPSLEEYNAINNAAPSTLSLTRDRDDPQARAGQLASTRSLIGRALANLTKLRRATTPYPPLRSMLSPIIKAQSSQLAGLRAAERFLETGDTENLNGSGGMLEAITTAKKAIQSFQDEQIRFLRENKLIPENEGP